MSSANVRSSSEVSRAEREKQEKKEADALSAKLEDRKLDPTTVRSLKFNLKDPETGIAIPKGKLIELPFISGWVQSQIDHELIEVYSKGSDESKQRAKNEKAAAEISKEADKAQEEAKETEAENVKGSIFGKKK